MINKIIILENVPVNHLNVIAVSDEFLRKLHRNYLKKNSYTDVITFRLDDKEPVEAEIYISVDRAKIHAKQFGVPLHDELARLIVHGLLHIKGFDDRTEPERKEMTNMENTLLKRNWKY
jgi:rRNA maturation RNase YbeY